MPGMTQTALFHSDSVSGQVHRAFAASLLARALPRASEASLRLMLAPVS